MGQPKGFYKERYRDDHGLRDSRQEKKRDRSGRTNSKTVVTGVPGSAGLL